MKKFLPFLIVLFALPAFADNVSYSIRIVEQNNRNPVTEALVRAIDLTEGKTVMAVSNDSGYVALQLKADNKYRIDVSKRTKEEGIKYITYSYFLGGIEILRPTFKEVSLEKVKINSQVELTNIYFEAGKAELTGMDKMALANTLVALRNSPSLNVEIIVRAACNETEEVAEKRYELIKTYFADKSDFAKRITVKNLGKTNQVAGCNCNSPVVYSDAAYTMNRVAEFRVTNF
jgi:outer membrane protein OmpA-like peptidoglycan-associated protein